LCCPQLLGRYVIPRFEWRAGYLTLAFLVWIIIVPLALFVIKTKPADMGLHPDGMNASEWATTVRSSPQTLEGMSLKKALVVSAFWFIGISYFFNEFSQVGAIQSQVSFVQDIGFLFNWQLAYWIFWL